MYGLGGGKAIYIAKFGKGTCGFRSVLFFCSVVFFLFGSFLFLLFIFFCVFFSVFCFSESLFCWVSVFLILTVEKKNDTKAKSWVHMHTNSKRTELESPGCSSFEEN